MRLIRRIIIIIILDVYILPKILLFSSLACQGASSLWIVLRLTRLHYYYYYYYYYDSCYKVLDIKRYSRMTRETDTR